MRTYKINDKWIKECTKCHGTKNIEYFNKNKNTKDGLAYRCKKCSVYQKKEHPMVIDIRNNYKICNKCNEKLSLENFETRKQGTLYRKQCKKCRLDEQNEYRSKNGDKVRANARRYGKLARKIPRLRKRLLKEKKRYYLKNNTLDAKMRTSLNHALNGKKAGRHWETLVDYTLDDLKKHLESQFINGMNWNKFKNGKIHIDHILPLALFSYEDENDIQFKICWSLKNLRPLWAKENIIKQDLLPDGRTARSLSIEEKLEYLKSIGLL
jgi:hypothetical protein